MRSTSARARTRTGSSSDSAIEVAASSAAISAQSSSSVCAARTRAQLQVPHVQQDAGTKSKMKAHPRCVSALSSQSLDPVSLNPGSCGRAVWLFAVVEGDPTLEAMALATASRVASEATSVSVLPRGRILFGAAQTCPFYVREVAG